jgi:hypothetical protein
MSEPHSAEHGSPIVSLADEEGVKQVLVGTVLGLREIVNNLTRVRPSKRERSRVTMFGSARPWRASFVYDEAKRVTRVLDADDLSIPRCIATADEAMAVIREHHGRWLRARPATPVPHGQG